MNTRKTVYVFVKRDKSAYIASVGTTEHTSLISSTVAAQMAAAHHYGVPREQIELLPNGPHSLIASVKRPGSPIAWGLLWSCLGAATVAAICVVIWKGGAA